MRPSVIAVVAVAATTLVAPAAASGKTYCAFLPQDPEPRPPCETIYPRVQDALSAAQANPGTDTVRVGVGSFIAPPGSPFSHIGGAVHLVGSGPGTRLLRGDAGEVVSLGSTAASTVSSLTVVPLDGAGPSMPSVGVRATNATITEVTVDPVNITANVIGFSLDSGTLNGVSAVFPAASSGTTGAKFTGTGPGTSATINRASLGGNAGIQLETPSADVTATRVTGRAYGIATKRDLSVTNSQIRITPAGTNQFGIWVDASQNATVFARHTTIVADGAADSSAGVYARAMYLAGPPIAVQVYVNNSIVRGFASAFASLPQPASLTASATITPRYSAFPAGSSYVPDPSNLHVDPGFADAAAGDYRLTAGSPLIDRGDPETVPFGDSLTDLAGNTRIVDGDGNGSTIRDIGAFEYQPPPAPDSSSPGTTPGAEPAGAALPQGAAPTATAPTSVTALKLSPTRFTAAGRGAAVTPAGGKKKPKPGAKVSFTLSQAGTAAFAIEKRTTGRRSGRRCVKATRKNRKARKCTRWVLVKKSGFTRDGAAGVNAFRITGRVGRKSLSVGSYRLEGRAGTTRKRAAFRIVR